MFKEHATDLLSIMGIELQPLGVISTEQLREAHALLVAAIHTEKMSKANQPSPAIEDLSPEDQQALNNQISLEQRAYPLVKMLEAAIQQQVDVHWGF